MSANSCDKCQCGLIDPPAPPVTLPLYRARTVQYLAGELVFCTCENARRYFTYLNVQVETYQSDAHIMAQANQRYAERQKEFLWQNAKVPPKYAAYTFGSYVAKAAGDPGKQEAITAIRQLQETGSVGDKPGLLLWGAPGVGKTGALSPLFLHFLRQGQTGLWVQYNELMSEMRKFEDGNVGSRMEMCKSIDVLFIDDFGDPAAEKAASDYSRDVMFRIIDYRLNNGKRMLITSNLDLDKIADQFHARIARRLKECCAVVAVGGRPLGNEKEVGF